MGVAVNVSVCLCPSFPLNLPHSLADPRYLCVVYCAPRFTFSKYYGWKEAKIVHHLECCSSRHGDQMHMLQLLIQNKNNKKVYFALTAQ